MRDYYRINKEKILGNTRRWEKENRKQYLLIKTKANHKRRASKLNTKSKLNSEEINQLIINSNNICFWCDSYTEKIHLDHITPLSKGGEDKITNLVISCPSCNVRKNNKNPEIWLEEILAERK